MNIQDKLTTAIKEAVSKLYKTDLPTVEFQATRKEFEGDITAVIFSMLRTIKGNPLQIGEAIGGYLIKNVAEVKGFNMVKGFLNIVISESHYVNLFEKIKKQENFGFVKSVSSKKAVMVEYSSPNTNKPLHLGHVRNNLLGYSVAEIIKASGKKVIKTQIINDRGIHICKSMLAWEKFAPNGKDGKKETPETTLNLDLRKGDKLVGNYYVKFDQEYKKEITVLIANGKTKEEAKQEAPLMQEAQQMLQKWEAGDEKVVALWKIMNQWVYDGFAVTYKALGVDFDSLYYESNTYLLGKDNIEEGVKNGVFYKKDDGSVWCKFTEEGLDEKLVLRSDGTAVYMTQDIGTAIQRAKDYPEVEAMVYTVGNEQDYHFKVLFLILKKLDYHWAKNLSHLSYGMVDLPSGKMKSREGTVVDADDLMQEMTSTAREISQELGKLDGYTNQQKEEIYNIIGMGALKYFILKVDPKKRILFDPKESVDFQGNTGPFIQYTYARIQAILRRFKTDKNIENINLIAVEANIKLDSKEKDLIKQIALFPEAIQQAATNQSPANIANYTYDLVKTYNSFFQNVSIFGADTENEKLFRVQLSETVGKVIKNAFSLMGINVPERM